MLLAYTFQSILLALVSNGLAEMTTFMPVSGGYIRLAGRWVDEAFGKHTIFSRRSMNLGDKHTNTKTNRLEFHC